MQTTTGDGKKTPFGNANLISALFISRPSFIVMNPVIDKNVPQGANICI